MLTITKANLLAIAPHADATIVDGIVANQKLLADAGILDNTKRVAHFMAQYAEETDGLTTYVENATYTTAQRIKDVWPTRFPTLTSAQPYVRQPVNLLNFVYANRMGNGAPETGDGYRYRGRGGFNDTGREGYGLYKELTGVNVVDNPDLLGKEPDAIREAVEYWTSHNLSPMADNNDLAGITKAINGGLIGLDIRKTYLDRAVAVAWGVDAPAPAKPAINLSLGASGPQVLETQQILTGALYYTGDLDSVYGTETKSAVTHMQIANGLVDDGVIGPKTWDRLHTGLIAMPAPVAAEVPKPASQAPPTAPASPASNAGPAATIPVADALPVTAPATTQMPVPANPSHNPWAEIGILVVAAGAFFTTHHAAGYALGGVSVLAIAGVVIFKLTSRKGK